MAVAHDLRGQKYGRLLPIRRRDQVLASGRTLTAWDCECECGGQKNVLAMHLKSGRITSCGCAYREYRAKSRKPGGNVRYWPEYGIWQAMKNRCYRPSTHAFEHYGGRGIKVCDRWRFGEDGKTGFECFIEDMGRRPKGPTEAHKDLYTVERIDTDGDYKPGNCCWATWTEQQNNRRNTR